MTHMLFIHPQSSHSLSDMLQGWKVLSVGLPFLAMFTVHTQPFSDVIRSHNVTEQREHNCCFHLNDDDDDDNNDDNDDVAVVRLPLHCRYTVITLLSHCCHSAIHA
jgi:hypothetical protein